MAAGRRQLARPSSEEITRRPERWDQLDAGPSTLRSTLAFAASMRLMTSRVRSRSGFENIGADARSAIGATVVFNGQQCLALRILADGHTVHFERAHLDMNSGGMVDGFDHGVEPVRRQRDHG